MEDAVLLDVTARLAKKLLEFARDYGMARPEGTVIGLRLTRADVASVVGATRESVNKPMGLFRGQEVLEMQHGRIVIRRPEELERRIY
ncbi:MAG TPA: helix-turn-helix domain-containing protein [Chloroflexota bacterium]|nr:helix-turn-helix domain-containing protein [Chloroflexota bacterium]